MLRFFSVAEAHGLIYPRRWGENFSFAWTDINYSHLSSLYYTIQVIQNRL